MTQRTKRPKLAQGEHALATDSLDKLAEEILDVLGQSVPVGTILGQLQEGWIASFQKRSTAKAAVDAILRGRVIEVVRCS